MPVAEEDSELLVETSADSTERCTADNDGKIAAEWGVGSTKTASPVSDTNIDEDSNVPRKRRRFIKTRVSVPESVASKTQKAQAITTSTGPILLGQCVQQETDTGAVAKFARGSDFYFWPPENNQRMTNEPWISSIDLPEGLLQQITTAFCREYQSTPSKVRYYGEMIHQSKSYLDRAVCIAAKSISRQSSGHKYAIAGGDFFRACDTCIEKRRICARLVSVKDEVKIGILPLPQSRRGGASWRDMAFWVRP